MKPNPSKQPSEGKPPEPTLLLRDLAQAAHKKVLATERFQEAIDALWEKNPAFRQRVVEHAMLEERFRSRVIFFTLQNFNLEVKIQKKKGGETKWEQI